MKHLTLVVALVLAACVKDVPSPRERTIVFIAKRVITMDPKHPNAEAIAWRNGKIVAVGREDVVRAQAGSNAAIERFPGSTIVPGLVDSHGHLEGLGTVLLSVSLAGARDADDAASRLKNPSRASFQGDWLLGGGWDQNTWVTKAFPTRATLDAIDAKTPMLLERVDGHAAWVNSEALKRAGITRATQDPAGGRIIRDSKGEPTGVLVDAAMSLVTAHVPPATEEQMQRRLKIAIETCARLGLTQVHDAGTGLHAFHQLQQWDLLGALPIRIYAMAAGMSGDADDFLGRGVFKGRHLELRAVKFMIDGALGSRGAALEAPYADEPLQKGLLLLEPAELSRRAKAFSARGFQIAVHAIGDRANDIALDVLTEVPFDLRPRIEHVQVLKQADVARFSSSGMIASVQPTHATSDMPWAEARLGPERITLAYAYKTLLDAKAHLALGSDFPVESPNPLLGIYAARTRQDVHAWPPEGWFPAQRLSGAETLAGFTTGGAYASFAETERGQLAVGFDADLVVLPVDPENDAPASLLEAKVQVTVVDGVDVYRAP